MVAMVAHKRFRVNHFALTISRNGDSLPMQSQTLRTAFTLKGKHNMLNKLFKAMYDVIEENNDKSDADKAIRSYLVAKLTKWNIKRYTKRANILAKQYNATEGERTVARNLILHSTLNQFYRPSFPATIDATIPLANELFRALSPFVGVQPLESHVAPVFIMESKKTEEGKITLDVNQYAIQVDKNKRLAMALDVEHPTENLLEYTNAFLSDVFRTLSSHVPEENVITVPNNRGAEQIIEMIAKESGSLLSKNRYGATASFIVFPREFEQDVSRIAQVGEPITDTLSFFGEYTRPSVKKSIKVYVSRERSIDDGILFGYRGEHAAADSGFIFAPYILLSPMAELDAEGKRVELMTRYYLGSPSKDGNSRYGKVVIK